MTGPRGRLPVGGSPKKAGSKDSSTGRGLDCHWWDPPGLESLLLPVELMLPVIPYLILVRGIVLQLVAVLYLKRGI